MHVYFPSSFFVTLTKLKGTPWNSCLLLLLLWYLTESCWFWFMTSYDPFLLSVLLPELLEWKGNQRSHWKWGLASLCALHIKVAFSPTKTVAFDIGRTTGLARARSTKEENRYADIIKEAWDWLTNRILKVIVASALLKPVKKLVKLWQKTDRNAPITFTVFIPNNILLTDDQ